MLGGIYSNQKCPICGGKFKDDGKRGLICEKHPEQRATNIFVRFKEGVFKRFTEYEKAQRFITGLRYKYDEGSFDSRDYRKDNPLGFENLAAQYLETKKNGVKSFRTINYHMGKAIQYWGNKNIKEIQYADLEDFLLMKDRRAGEILKNHKTGKPLSEKSRANVKATLHNFWEWMRKRRVIDASQIPEFPEINYELGWREIIDKETQQAIIDEVQEICEPVNIKIWLGIKWLATYISIRPKELLNIKEGDFDLDLGVVLIKDPKEGRPKTVPLLDEDIEWVMSFPKGFPSLPFFRHREGLKGITGGKRFGEHLFYTYWKKACKNLGIEGVDLYGGTRHSSARALREFHSPEEIKKATMHATNKAFERYFQIEVEDVRNIYRNTKKAAPNLHQNSVQPKNAKLLKFKKKDGGRCGI